MEKRSTRGAAHRPSFAKIERALPALGSEQAEVLHHVFHCESCTEAALHILRMGLGKSFATRSRYNYERAFEAVEARREEILAKFERASGCEACTDAALSSRMEGDVEEAKALLDRAAHLLGDEALEDFDA